MVNHISQNGKICSSYDASMESMIYNDEYELDEFYDKINPQQSVEPLYNLATIFVWVWIIIVIILMFILQGYCQ